jgi:hypothetical protein
MLCLLNLRCNLLLTCHLIDLSLVKMEARTPQEMFEEINNLAQIITGLSSSIFELLVIFTTHKQSTFKPWGKEIGKGERRIKETSVLKRIKDGGPQCPTPRGVKMAYT